MILALISLVLIWAYIVYAIRVIKSVPWSISDTYYQLEKRNRPKWLFQVAMIVPAMLLLPAWLELSPEKYQFLAFLSCAGLVFVGVAPCFKLQFDGQVHYSATAICGSSSIIWTCMAGLWYIPLILLIGSLGLMLRYRRPIFWVELALFFSIYISIIYLL